jgi:hypothetical protein
VSLLDGKTGIWSVSNLERSVIRRYPIKMITEVIPNQLKLDYALWTRKAVRNLIERGFNIVK